MKKLASAIAKREGKKVEVPIGNIREVLRCFEDIVIEEVTKKGKSIHLLGFMRSVVKKLAKQKIQLTVQFTTDATKAKGKKK